MTTKTRPLPPVLSPKPIPFGASKLLPHLYGEPPAGKLSQIAQLETSVKEFEFDLECDGGVGFEADTDQEMRCVGGQSVTIPRPSILRLN